MAKRRQRQGKLPGHENVYIDELDDAARTYHSAKTDRVDATNSETDAKASAIEKMLSHGVEHYESVDGILLTVTQKSNLKSKKKGEVDEDENGEA